MVVVASLTARRFTLAILALAVVSACGSQPSEVPQGASESDATHVGWLLSFDESTGHGILCTTSGGIRPLQFDVETAAGYGFPVSHLTEHRAGEMPVQVTTSAERPAHVVSVRDAPIPGSPDCSQSSEATTKTGALSGVLPNGVEFEVAGLPAITDSTHAVGVSVPLMVDLGDGTVHPLGEVYAAQSATNAPEGKSPSPRDGYLHLISPGWQLTVRVYDEVLRSVPIDVLASAMTTTTRDGVPVLSVTDPVRFGDPGELPLELSTDYGGFVVSAGCPPAQPRIVCSADRSLFVQLNAGAEPAESVSVRRTG